MLKSWRYSFTGLLTVLGLLVSLFVAASPAQAYVNSELYYKRATVDTGNCERTDGTLAVYPTSTGCKIYDSADNTFFKKDAGGEAMKIVVYRAGKMVAKVEFHPYGEYLWVYDTANDGDTIYVTINAASYPGRPYFHEKSGPYRAPGTSKVVEYKKIDLDYPEGVEVGVRIYDDSGTKDRLTGYFTGIG